MKQYLTYRVFPGLAVAGALALTVWMAPHANAEVLGYWRFEPDNPSTATVNEFLADSSPDNPSTNYALTDYGNVSSNTSTPGIGIGSQGSANFDGVDDAFDVAAFDASGETAITIEFFLKPVTISGAQIIVEHSEAFSFSSNAGAFLVFIDDSGSSLHGSQGFTGADNYEDSENGVVSEGISAQWTHYAIIVDTTKNASDRIRLFVDYQEVLTPDAEALATGDPALANYELNIGARDGAESLFYDGLLDELRISGGALDRSKFLGSTIPEPATLALLGLGGLAMLGRRRR